jgi:hypothetical protein
MKLITKFIIILTIFSNAAFASHAAFKPKKHASRNLAKVKGSGPGIKQVKIDFTYDDTQPSRKQGRDQVAQALREARATHVRSHSVDVGGFISIEDESHGFTN